MTTEATTPTAAASTIDGDLHDISSPTTPESVVVLTESAATKVKELLTQQPKSDLALRVAARPGGCSGMQYQLFFDDQAHESDDRFELHGVPMVIDHISGPFLSGATIDFVETTEKQGFTIDNPNAMTEGGGCGCGSESSSHSHGAPQGGGCGSGGCGCG